jgi:hypothetical protein
VQAIENSVADQMQMKNWGCVVDNVTHDQILNALDEIKQEEPKQVKLPPRQKRGRKVIL